MASLNAGTHLVAEILTLSIVINDGAIEISCRPRVKFKIHPLSAGDLDKFIVPYSFNKAGFYFKITR
jgi:hypothetical protein